MRLPKFQSIKENISVKDVLFSGAPTAGTYSGYLNGYLNGILPKWLINNPSLALIITLVVFVIILIILYYFNAEAHTRSLAEILATGYFLNFSGKLTSLLKQNRPITFTRSAGDLVVEPNKVKLEVILPSSRSDLETMTSYIDQATEIAYIISSPYTDPSWWLKIKVDALNGSVNILELPRTLFALPNYLSSEYSDDKSKKLHEAFNKKFKQLVDDNPDKRPPNNRFEIKNKV